LILNSQVLKFIPDPGSGFFPSRIPDPDPRVKKPPDPVSATLVNTPSGHVILALEYNINKSDKTFSVSKRMISQCLFF
jgi:hypothetical protein